MRLSKYDFFFAVPIFFGGDPSFIFVGMSNNFFSSFFLGMSRKNWGGGQPFLLFFVTKKFGGGPNKKVLYEP